MSRGAGVRLKDGLLELIFPPKCLFCRRLLKGSYVCKECRGKLPYCRGEQLRPDFCESSVSALHYVGSVRRKMLAMKFSGKSSDVLGFAELLADAVRQELPGKYDLVTWVPVSMKRLRERGFDQSKLLAVRTAELLGLPSRRLLRKVRHTPAQSGFKTIDSRRANVSGAYKVVRPEAIGGLRILLIDDVFTTGATLSECSRVLITAGAGSVSCATVAKAGLFQ